MTTSKGKARSQKDQIFFNREISWLNFNERVLDEAFDQNNPLLERVKFLAIFCSNLDEFFMVRVGSYRELVRKKINVVTDSPDGLPSDQVLKDVRLTVERLNDKVAQLLKKSLIGDLRSEGIQIKGCGDLEVEERRFLERHFRTNVFPMLTPLAFDPGHPFPMIRNLSLYVVVKLKSRQSGTIPPFALVEVPAPCARLIRIPGHGFPFVLLEDLISSHLDELFPGQEIEGHFLLRLTRNLDLNLKEGEVVDLLSSIQKEVKKAQQAEAVRMELQGQVDQDVVNYLSEILELSKDEVYHTPQPLKFGDFKNLLKLPLDHLKDMPFNPRLPNEFRKNEQIFEIISQQDVLLHHPYDSFYAVLEFLTAAAYDPKVVAIKQTLYRTSGDSLVIDRLITAAEMGKHVTAVVELKARFDETNNITWARQMERGGVNVVYGFVNLKTHLKSTIVVRREAQGLVRYAHIATGNYNSTTATVYEDLGLLTKRACITDEISRVFNIITGFNSYGSGDISDLPLQTFPKFKTLLVSPLSMKSSLIKLIRAEIAHQEKFGNGYIRCKMNALVDQDIIKALYQASIKGVKIELLVRGICCLIPGVPGLSENILVVSLIDRFLEHSRIFYFHANGEERYYIGSADWMPRNMERRFEVLVPILDEKVKLRLEHILNIYWADNSKLRQLHPDGSYRLVSNANTFRAQLRFIELAREVGIKSLPYEQAIRHNTIKKKGLRPVSAKSRKKNRS